MPFVSIFEQVILEQKEQLQDLKQQILKKDQQLRDLDQQILKKEEQIRNNVHHLREIRWLGIRVALKLKFQASGQALFAEVQKQTNLAWLERFFESIESAASVEDLRKLLP